MVECEPCCAYLCAECSGPHECGPAEPPDRYDDARELEWDRTEKAWVVG